MRGRLVSVQFYWFTILLLHSRDEHNQHQCGLGQPCPMRCQFTDCENYCSSRDHFHALMEGAIHLCGYESLAGSQFITNEISEINTRVPTNVTGRASVKLIQFRKGYIPPLMVVTNVSILPRSVLRTGDQGTISSRPKQTQEARYLKCAISIPAHQLSHAGNHVHSETSDVHYCETRCPHCEYFCSCPISAYRSGSPASDKTDVSFRSFSGSAHDQPRIHG